MLLDAGNESQEVEVEVVGKESHEEEDDDAGPAAVVAGVEDAGPPKDPHTSSDPPEVLHD